MKILRYIIPVILIAAAVGAVAWYARGRYADPAPSRVEIQPARIADIQAMLRLCSLELYEEVPVRASIGHRHLFATAALNASISFDLEKMQVEESADTLAVVLPPEIVEIYESADAGAYRVVDTWNDRLLGSSHFTAAEENAIKRRAVASVRRSIYSRGHVARARREAAANLRTMLATLTPKTVVVTDPGSGV